MGTIPFDDVRVVCSDGVVIVIDSGTSCDDLGRDDGTAWIGGTIGKETVFDLQVLLTVYSERWFRRFCDAIAANTEFRQSLSGIREISGDFVIPGAPSRDGAIGGLAAKGGKARFRDFADLRSGRDRFSTVSLPQLEAAAGEEAVSAVRRLMAGVPDEDRGAELAKALRWVLRGLPAAMAVRKTEVDREISASVKQSAKRHAAA